MKRSRRLVAAIPAALLGIALAATAAACQPSDSGGSESTAEVCTDLGDNVPMMVASIEASPLELAFYPTPVPAADQARIVSDTRGSYRQLSDTLRGEADTAADEDTVTALTTTADGVDARAATVNTVDDVAAITNDNAVDISPLYPVCPDLLLDQKSG